ncbi:MAG: RnfABCDGE type electron transport complex subunit B [Gammaproteobacteria bacterium]
MNATGGKDAVKPSSADCIDALLPQTQCIQCGFPSCREYAEALVAGQAELNRCPPGGTATIAALALALGREPKALDPACGDERPWVVARIDEAACIGCTLCIQACPVDAILGTAKRMHTVIESECTGCELCLDPCPVDCIDLAPTSPGQGLFLQSSFIPAIHGGQTPEPMTATDAGTQPRWNAGLADSFLEGWMRERAPLARRRFHARQQRQLRLRQARAERRRFKHAAMPGRDADRATKQAVIRSAVDRARHRRRGAHD